MQFHSDGQTYKAVSITGPTHNFLGIEFAQAGDESVVVAIEPVQLKPNEPVRLDGEEVLKWVLDGVREANEELGTAYRPQRITFVLGDSPPAEVYRSLAKRIAHRLNAQPMAFTGSED